MTFKELIQKNSWETLASLFLETYPDSKENKQEYKKVFEELKTMPPKETDMWLVLKKETSGEEEYVDVAGLHKHPKSEEEKYAQGIEFLSWHNWLDMDIQEETLQTFSEQEILVHCLYEMTYVGFSEEQIQERVRKANQNGGEKEAMTEEDYAETEAAIRKMFEEIEEE